jgi:photosystem II stability/assembly factor-like uncharacterized protein
MLFIAFQLFVGDVAHGSWDRVGQFQYRVRAGWFFDVNHGMVCLDRGHDGIRLTFDGGQTWQVAQTPSSSPSATITDIFFNSRTEGWASVTLNSPQSGLWHTTDGGSTWTETGYFGTPNAVRATSKAVIVDDYIGGMAISTDGGITFVAGSGDARNGIDFVDDLRGVSAGTSSNPYLFTTDGGVSWSPSQCLRFVEGFGAYGYKGSRTFLVASEMFPGNSSVPSEILISIDFGQNWTVLTTLPFVVTGDIEGGRTGVYVQNNGGITTPAGLYRSVDTGKTWQSIGGPNYSGCDTRFVVVNCTDIIYAFDPFGNVWRSSDFGDSTLHGLSSSGSSFLVDAATQRDTVSICKVVDTLIRIGFVGCAGTDSLLLTNAELSGTGSIRLGNDSLPRRISAYDSIPLVISAVGNTSDTSFIKLSYILDGISADTTITLISYHTTAGVSSTYSMGILHVPSDNPVPLSVSILLPLQLRGSKSLAHAIRYTLTYNSAVIDMVPSKVLSLLTPPPGWVVRNAVIGTNYLTVTLSNSNGAPLSDSLYLGIARFTAFQDSVTSTLVIISQVDLTLDSNTVSLCFGLEGDFLANVIVHDASSVGRMPLSSPTLSIAPNPVGEDGLLYVTLNGLTAGQASITLFDVLGTSVLSHSLLESEKQSVSLSLAGLPTGSYYLQLRDHFHVLTKKLIVR